MPDEIDTGQRWQYVRTDDLLALHKVALQARDAVEVAEALGVQLNPLRTALEATPYRVEGNRGWASDRDVAGDPPSAGKD
jgi:hypothetical protein